MANSDELIIYPYHRAETATDSGDGLTFNLTGHDALLPADDADNGVTPIVYVDGEEIDSSNYTFNDGDQTTDCSITFNSDQSGNTVTCTYKWKYIPTTEEDLTKYELEKIPNSQAGVDVNGKTIITSSYSRVTAWRAILGWSYIDQDFWEWLRVWAEEDYYTFDIARESLSDPLDRINDLYIMSFPTFVDIPGLPGMYNITIEVVQVE